MIPFFISVITLGKTNELSKDLSQNDIDYHKVGNSYGNLLARLCVHVSAVQSIINKFTRFARKKWYWKEIF